MTRLHEWAATTGSGDRDELVPGVDDRAWRQVSVNARECIGAQKCPFGTRCFAEQAREAAGEADIVVTNHALLAIDAMENYIVLPEHDVVVIDEAHDLVDRVTSVAAGELSASARRGRRPAVRTAGRRGADRAAARRPRKGLGLALADTAGWPARRTGRAGRGGARRRCGTPPRPARPICAVTRAPRTTATGLAANRVATVALDEVAENAGRMITAYGAEIPATDRGGLAGPSRQRGVGPA